MAERICITSECDRPAETVGLCMRCYHRQWRAVHRPPKNRKPVPVLERLARKSVRDGECLVWTGATSPTGYGLVRFDRDRSMAVHRAAWIARHGEPPAETPCVLHRCDNPPCWRDEHLFLGTQPDNVADMVAKGRHGNQRKTHCPEGHPYDEANTRVVDGHRRCRACSRTKALERWHRRKAS